MAATFNWAQTIGAPAGTRSDLGSSGNLFNFKNADTIGIADYATYPVAAGSNSFEVWLQGHFSGVFNTISDLRFWMSTDFSPNTGLTLKINPTAQVAYAQPTNATSSKATATISTSDPGTRNVAVGGDLVTNLSTSGYTNYLVLQLQSTVAAAAGDSSLCTFSMSYIES